MRVGAGVVQTPKTAAAAARRTFSGMAAFAASSLALGSFASPSAAILRGCGLLRGA